MRLGPGKLCLAVLAVVVLVALPVVPLELFSSSFARWNGFRLADLSPLLDAENRQKKPPQKAIVKARTESMPGPIQPEASLEQAVRDLTAQISNFPADPALQNRIGLVYSRLGELDRAQRHFENAIELARVGLGNANEKQPVLQAQGKLAESSALVLETARLNIELSAAHSNLARVYYRLGQDSKVLAELDMLKKEGVIENPEAAKRSGVAQADSLHVDPAVARLFSDAESLMRSRRFAEAIQEFRNVIALDPSSAAAHSRLGILSAMANNAQGAVAELETAIRLDPSDAITRNNLGIAYTTTGKLNEAKAQFKQALARNPKLVDAAVNLASLYASKESYVDAKQVLEQAVAANPGSAIAHNDLATILSLNDDTGQAIDEFRKAMAIEPNMVSVHYGLGLALFKARHYRESEKELKQAVMMDPRLIGAYDKIEQAARRLASGESGV